MDIEFINNTSYEWRIVGTDQDHHRCIDITCNNHLKAQWLKNFIQDLQENNYLDKQIIGRVNIVCKAIGLSNIHSPLQDFYAYERVIVSKGPGHFWTCDLFSHYWDRLISTEPFITIGGKSFPYCIPYAGNTHLVGQLMANKDLFEIG